MSTYFPAWRDTRTELGPPVKYPEDRRRTILEIVAGLDGATPPCRKMVRLLNERGFTIGHVQVSHDYKLLNLKSARTPEREANVQRKEL